MRTFLTTAAVCTVLFIPTLSEAAPYRHHVARDTGGGASSPRSGTDRTYLSGGQTVTPCPDQGTVNGYDTRSVDRTDGPGNALTPNPEYRGDVGDGTC